MILRQLLAASLAAASFDPAAIDRTEDLPDGPVAPLPGRLDEESLPPLPSYPGSVTIRIGGATRLGSLRAELGYLLTPTPAEVVAHEFVARWHREGLPTTLDSPNPSEWVVGAFDTRAGVLHSAMARRHGPQTVVLLARLDLWSDGDTGDLPPTPDELFANRSGAEVTFVQATMSTVRASLERAAAAKHLALTQTELGRDWILLEHARPPVRVLTALVTVAPGTTAVWQLHEEGLR